MGEYRHMYVELIARQTACQQHELFLRAAANERGDDVQESNHWAISDCWLRIVDWIATNSVMQSWSAAQGTCHVLARSRSISAR
jgi:hypothetical protein